MYNLERPLRYSHVLTKHCPCHLLPGRASPKHEHRGPTLRPLCDVIGDIITMKNTFLYYLGRSFLIWGQNEVAFYISKFSKWPPFWGRDKLFLPEVIPGGEYTSSTEFDRVRHVSPTFVPNPKVSPLVLLYPPYPKDRGMLWFYVEAARRPPSAARRPPPAARRPPPAMVLTR